MQDERNIVEGIETADIRAELTRIVASTSFNNSPQLANFLTFVVNETLAGRGDRIKAYNIAADALGRDADFDPQNDPIVRVEAGRLRRALGFYYANGGAGDPVIIEMPRGHYVPVFSKKARLGVFARPRILLRGLAATLRQNIKLVLLIVAIATAVSLAVNLLAIVVAGSIGSTADDAVLVTAPAAASETPVR